MLELRCVQGSLLVDILKSAGGLGTHAHFDFSSAGLDIQVMNTSHSAFVAVHLGSEAFDYYRCDRHTSMGINLQNLIDVLEPAGEEDDTIIMEAQHNSDSVTCMFENPNGDKTVDFEVKRVKIDGRLDMTEFYYGATVEMPYSEFAWICQYLKRTSDPDKPVTISVTSEGIKFSAQTYHGTTANIVCRESPDLVKSGDGTHVMVDLQILYSFSTAYPWSSTVTIRMSWISLLVVEYKIDEMGYIRFHLPGLEKIGNDEDASDVVDADDMA